jgi:WD40 repeat protein
MLFPRRVIIGFLACLALTHNAAWGDEPRLDLHGDPLPEGAVARLGSSRLRHDDWIRNLVFLPNGKSLMAATNEPFVRIWDVASGREVRQIGKTDSSLMSAALSPDGRTIAAGENGNTEALTKFLPIKRLAETAEMSDSEQVTSCVAPKDPVTQPTALSRV